MITEYPDSWLDYELIDSGSGEKLERIGNYTVNRPDPRIIWQKKAPPDIWSSADARYIRSSSTEGHWKINKPPPENWHIRYHNLVFTLRPTEFKHFGVFPEQAVNWEWIIEAVSNQLAANSQKKFKLLNLFAYTGGATMAALDAGAEVTHVDSVRSSVDWASENIRISGMTGKPVHWIVEDAYKFVVREGRRGHCYDGIIMDPPRFGRGPKGEVWKLEKDLPKMLAAVKSIMSPDPLLFLINAYTADISPTALENALKDILPGTGNLESGELALKESYGKRLIPNGIYVRWSE